jgi:hypothetical protein
MPKGEGPEGRMARRTKGLHMIRQRQLRWRMLLTGRTVSSWRPSRVGGYRDDGRFALPALGEGGERGRVIEFSGSLLKATWIDFKTEGSVCKSTQERGERESEESTSDLQYDTTFLLSLPSLDPYSLAPLFPPFPPLPKTNSLTSSSISLTSPNLITLTPFGSSFSFAASKRPLNSAARFFCFNSAEVRASCTTASGFSSASGVIEGEGGPETSGSKVSSEMVGLGIEVIGSGVVDDDGAEVDRESEMEAVVVEEGFLEGEVDAVGIVGICKSGRGLLGDSAS